MLFRPTAVAIAILSSALSAQQPRPSVASAQSASCVKSIKDAESAKLTVLDYNRAIKGERRDTLPESGPSGVLGIRSLAVANDGSILLVDSRQKRVTLRNAKLQVQATLGREGEGPGEYRAPTYGAIGPDGQIWIADMELGRVSVYSAAGKFKRVMSRVSVDTRSIIPVSDSIAISVGASMSAQGDVIASSASLSGRTGWRSVPLDPILTQIKLIVDDAWGVATSPGTAIVGMSVLPTVTRIDINTGRITCASRLPSAGWHQLSAQERPRGESLDAARKWILNSSSTQGAGSMSTGQVVVGVESASKSDANAQSWVILDEDLTPRFGIANAPGRFLLVRKDTVWTTTATSDGQVVLIRSALDLTRVRKVQ